MRAFKAFRCVSIKRSERWAIFAYLIAFGVFSFCVRSVILALVLITGCAYQVPAPDMAIIKAWQGGNLEKGKISNEQNRQDTAVCPGKASETRKNAESNR